jgi:hypothetical protein
MCKRKRTTENGNNCAFCVVKSITKQNQHRYVEFKAWCSEGLRCTNCESPRLICHLCIIAIDKAIDKAVKSKGVSSAILSDPWIQELRKYVETRNLGFVQIFKGHCCDFDVRKMKKKEDVQRLEHQGKDMAYDGGLVLFGHGIMIETDCNSVDVNALGPDALAGIEKGIVHGVIDSFLARQLYRERYAPKAMDSNFKTMTYNIVVPSVAESGLERNVSHYYTIGTNANALWTHFLS